MSPGHPYPTTDWSEAEAEVGENKTSRHGNGKNKRNGKGKASRDITCFEVFSEVPGHYATGRRPADHAGTSPKNYPLIQKGPRPSSLPKRPAAHNGGMIKETDAKKTSTTKGKDSPSMVAAPSPSSQEAECAGENHLLLKSGSCICPRDFSFYQTPEAFQYAWPCLQRSHEQAVHGTSFYAPGSQTRKTIYSSAPVHEQDLLNPRPAAPISQAYSNFATPGFQDPREPNYLGDMDGPETWPQSYSNQYSQAQLNQSWNQYPQFASSDKAYQYWTQVDPRRTSALSTATLPIRGPGVFYHADPTSTRPCHPSYHYTSNYGARNGPYVEASQAAECPTPVSARPGLFGLSAGGPGRQEGSAQTRSVASAEETEGDSGSDGKNKKKEDADETHRRLGRRATVSCLRELKVGRNPAGGQRFWRQGGSCSGAAHGPGFLCRVSG